MMRTLPRARRVPVIRTLRRISDTEVSVPISWRENTHAAIFNGSSYIRYGNPSKLQITGDITVVLSVKASQANPSTLGCPISKFGNSTNNRSWLIGHVNGSTNTYQVIISSDGSTSGTTHKWYVFTVPYSTTWQRIAYTYKSGGSGLLKIYVEGQEVAVTKTADHSVPSLFNSTSDLCVGALYDSGSPAYYSGRIDDVKIFNRELSAAEVSAEYNGGQGVDSTGAVGLVFWTKFDNNTTDSAPAPATATVTGSITYTEFSSSYFKINSSIVNKNVVDSSVGLGGKFSPHSDVRFVTTATKLRVLMYNNVHTLNNYWPKCSLWVDGVYSQEITGTANDQATEVEINLSAGTKEIKLVNAGNYYSSGVYYGAWIQRIYTNNIVFKKDKTSKTEVFVIGDSVTNGQAATIHTKDSWLPLLKEEFPTYTFRLFGGSALRFHNIASDSTVRNSTIAAIAPGIKSKTKKIFICLGINDHRNYPWTASQFQTAYDAFLQLINSTWPGLTICCFTPIIQTAEGANALGDTMDAFRTAIQNACAGKLYATAVDLKSTVLVGDLTDGIHPNNSGHTKLNNAIDDYVL